MTVRLMSDKELARFDTLARVDRGELAIADAVALLGLSERHVFRLLDRLRVDGVAGLASRRRGRPSNRRLPDELRTAAIALSARDITTSARPLPPRSSPSCTTSMSRRRRYAS